MLRTGFTPRFRRGRGPDDYARAVPAPNAPTSNAPAPNAPASPRPAAGRERILQAAAELFVREGYSATSTRDIAQAVGIKQPSLYSHFRLKSEILHELLLRTLAPALDVAGELRARTSASAVDRLSDLVRYDVHALCSVQPNLGLLYLMPDVNSNDFEECRTARQRLKAAYADLTRQALAETGASFAPSARMGEIVYFLVEGVILRREQTAHLDPDLTAAEVCVAVRRVVGASDR